MPFNFPDPAVSTTATNPVTGAQYQWKADPGKWVLTGGPAVSNPPVVIQLLPPDDPQTGDLWIHSETLIEYAWDGEQWFEVGSSCGGDSEEEEQEQYHPFVNSFKLVAPDNFVGDAGTAAILTDAYDAGDDSYLSPTVKSVRFADIDLNDRKLEPAVVGDTIELTPDNESEKGTKTLYGALEVTAVNSSANSITYNVDFDTNRSVIYTEGDIVHYRIDTSGLYVKKAGDTMTGTLVMDNADKILMQDTKLDFLTTGESLKDNNGDPVLDSEGKEKWDTSIDRYSHIESLPPRILRSDGTFGADTSAPFGIRVEIDDGNTHRNRFVVGNRNGDAVTITGGTGPNVQFGTGFDGNQNPATGDPHWVDGQAGGVKITGIPTPTKENPEFRLAVNKRYVDERDEEIRQDIIELEQEIDSIAPSVERGEWQYSDTGLATNAGSYSMNTDTLNAGLGDPANIFAAVENVVINEKDKAGTIHSFANVEAGQLLEIFEATNADYGLYEILDVTEQIGGGVGVIPAYTYWSLDVALVRTGQGDKASGLARFKIFSPPSGGTADGFVLKSGDEMTGELELSTEQADNTTDYNVPAAGTKHIRFVTKRLDTGSTYPVWLYQPGYGNYLMCSGSLMARDNLYTNKYIFATSYNSDGTRTTKNPRIYFNRDTSSGNVLSEYGALRWSANDRVYWDNDKVEVSKTPLVLDGSLATEDTHAIHKGYVDDKFDFSKYTELS